MDSSYCLYAKKASICVFLIPILRVEGFDSSMMFVVGKLHSFHSPLDRRFMTFRYGGPQIIYPLVNTP